VKTNTIHDIAGTVLSETRAFRQSREHILIAIDGRCAAGKSTLAAYLRKNCGCNIIHMDHFFLRPEQRTTERLNEPGGNVDYERFLKEVLIPLKQGKMFSYRPYDCHKQEFKETVWIEPNPVNIIEGSYSCHPALSAYYDLTIFLTLDEVEQLRRIRHRNGEMGSVLFQKKWIPLEERYFTAYHIRDHCDFNYQT